MPTRLGVFLIPPGDHPFARIAADVLGYDIRTRRRSPSCLAADLDEETLTRWLDFAPTFGIHCTLAGAALSYDDADLKEIEARLAWIASRTAPFRLLNGRVDEAFHANPRALVATFDSPNGAIHRLHRQVVTMVSPLHVRSAYAGRQERLSEEERRIYGRTGEPYALERFSPHWSLMTGLPDAAAWDTARDLIALRTGLFADHRTRTLDIADVHLVRQDDDGYFTIAASYPLTGG